MRLILVALLFAISYAQTDCTFTFLCTDCHITGSETRIGEFSEAECKSRCIAEPTCLGIDIGTSTSCYFNTEQNTLTEASSGYTAYKKTCNGCTWGLSQADMQLDGTGIAAPSGDNYFSEVTSIEACTAMCDGLANCNGATLASTLNRCYLKSGSTALATAQTENRISAIKTCPGTTTNAPFTLVGQSMWCGEASHPLIDYEETIEGTAGSIVGFMAWHKELLDTETPQICANAAAADPDCGNVFIMGSFYSFCMCVRQGATCAWTMEEADWEDESFLTKIYALGTTTQQIPPDVLPLRSQHKAESRSLDPLTLGLIGFGGILSGVLTFFAFSFVSRKCATEEQSNVNMDRLI